MIDNAHLFGLKRYLGVDRRTPNDLVYGEVGRFPIQINASVRCIRYWLKLTRIDEHRLPFSMGCVGHAISCRFSQRTCLAYVSGECHAIKIFRPGESPQTG